MSDDEYQAIGRQLGLFFRRADRFHQSIQLDACGRPLERAPACPPSPRTCA